VNTFTCASCWYTRPVALRVVKPGVKRPVCTTCVAKQATHRSGATQHANGYRAGKLRPWMKS